MKPFIPSSLAFPLRLLDLPAIKSWFSPFCVCAFRLGNQRQAPLRAFELVYILAKRVSLDFASVTQYILYSSQTANSVFDTHVLVPRQDSRIFGRKKQEFCDHFSWWNWGLVFWLLCFSLQRWVAPPPQIFFSSVTCSSTSPQMWVEVVAPPCWTVSFSSIDLRPTH